MARFAYVNGRYVDHRLASVHIEDRGYQLADGVYEVVGVRDGKLIELQTDNMLLGVDPDEQYRPQVIQLQSKDAILLYTDGLPDAMNFEKQTFGRERLIEAFKAATGTADEITQNILWTIRKFVGMARRNDDITMIVVKVE